MRMISNYSNELGHASLEKGWFRYYVKYFVRKRFTGISRYPDITRSFFDRGTAEDSFGTIVSVMEKLQKEI